MKRFFLVLVLLPSFLCLDAAFVALGWSLLFSGTPSSGKSEILSAWPGLTVSKGALFLSVWIIYLFDRLYDTRKPQEDPCSTLRHRFAFRHRPLLMVLFLVCGAFLLALLPQLRGPDWLLGLGAGGGVLFYFVLFRFRPKRKPPAMLRGFPAKEFSIGIFFTLGVLGAAGGFEVPKKEVSLVWLISCGSAFLLLVVINCLVIAAAECEFDRVHDPASYSSSSSRNGTRIPFAVSFLALTLALVALVSATRLPDAFFPAAILLAAASLIGLHHASILPTYRQPLSDAVMLIPWIFVLLQR